MEACNDPARPGRPPAAPGSFAAPGGDRAESVAGVSGDAAWSCARLYVAGGLMCCAAGALAVLAAQFATEAATPSGRRALTLWGALAGLVYVAGLWGVGRGVASRRQLLWILSVGLAMRAVILPTAPFLEDDYYRYLWDGAAIAHGVNPYRLAPAEALRAAADRQPGPLPGELTGAQARDVLARINHPHLATVYGPVAQLAFAAAHRIAPWSLPVWRGFVLAFDVLTMLSILALLRVLAAPVTWVAWYWWNPLVLRELISSGHMDGIALPLVVLSLILAIRRAPLPAGIVLAVAAGVKVWPVVLLPLVIRAASGRFRAAVLAAGAFVATSALLWPAALAGVHSESSGFRAYALTWYNNEAVFRVMVRALRGVLALLHVDPGHGPRLARYLAGGVLVFGVALQTWRLRREPQDLVRRCLLVVAVLFVLSPAQFPWYYVWMLPLLSAAPRPSLLAYTVTLPLYYAHYDHPWVVWIEHLPIIGWFLLESWIRTGRRRDEAPARAGSLRPPWSAAEVA